ncbi:hypothetical protein SNEBB_006975 [Seison nebaliae]|nr:hypothetical protein SNEBB_006975 [Seison nebaliae]
MESRSGGENSAELTRSKLPALKVKALTIRSNLEQLIEQFTKYRIDQQSWTDLFMKFVQVQTEISSFQKELNSGKFSNIHQFAIIPKQLVFQENQHLRKLTEGRVSTLDDAKMPNYLNTRLTNLNINPPQSHHLVSHSTSVRKQNANIDIKKEIENVTGFTKKIIEDIDKLLKDLDEQANVPSNDHLRLTTIKNDSDQLFAFTYYGVERSGNKSKGDGRKNKTPQLSHHTSNSRLGGN